jgi:hypothetical protein
MRAPRVSAEDISAGQCPTSQFAPWLANNFKWFCGEAGVGHSSEIARNDAGAEELLERRAQLEEESWLIQERVGPSFGPGSAEEFRAHTFWHRVVPEATFSRWDALWNDELFIEIEHTVQRFLDLFPPEVLRGHGWGLDVIRAAPGQIKIIDLNTNRGERQVERRSCHARCAQRVNAPLEVSRCRIRRRAGTKLRESLADQRKWIKKAGIKSVRRHEELRRQSWRLKVSRVGAAGVGRRTEDTGVTSERRRLA